MAILKFILAVIMLLLLMVFALFLISGMIMSILYLIQITKEIWEAIRND